MTYLSPSPNRRNILLFPGVATSKDDPQTPPRGPARVIHLARWLTKRGSPVVEVDQSATSEEA